MKYSIDNLIAVDNEYRELHGSFIVGVDEVGRGSLAGPIVACAIMLKPSFKLDGIRDSKQLSPIKRAEYSNAILTEGCIGYGIGEVQAEEIDKIGIVSATYKAMTEAIKKIEHNISCILIDGPSFKSDEICSKHKIFTIIKGDQKSYSIAAASIVAKVYRDNLMNCIIDDKYNFGKHKGYGTEKHIETIIKYGPSDWHRKSFIQKFINKRK